MRLISKKLTKDEEGDDVEDHKCGCGESNRKGMDRTTSVTASVTQITMMIINDSDQNDEDNDDYDVDE